MESILGILLAGLGCFLLIYYIWQKLRLWFLPKISPEAKALHRALVEMGIPAKLEFFDGYKTVDIAVPDANIHIEVDGSHHNTIARQALADLKRTYYSLQQNIYTIRIPNSLIRHNLDDTVEYVSRIIQTNYNKTRRRK
ncbi:hypothetical protein [Adhaeribacter aquaticus]|uniref:hypothetical protein n=1 Tax=Adhaeribacter aquaticus TaxID=299567 RepID=UPI0004264778|nr:hypothetical protein [Adhaeribacter aquaticus]